MISTLPLYAEIIALIFLACLISLFIGGVYACYRCQKCGRSEEQCNCRRAKR